MTDHFDIARLQAANRTAPPTMLDYDSAARPMTFAGGLGSEKAKLALLEGLTAHIDFALQPIVNIHTGTVFAFEALLRGQAKLGFAGIHDLFDALHESGMLYTADTVLRDIALAKFAKISSGENHYKLFYNLDNRIINAPDYKRGNTRRLIEKHNLPINAICFEISERHSFAEYVDAGRVLRRYQDQGYSLAIDDFGAGFAGLSLFYEQHPDFVKIDRFFMSNLHSDHKKKLFVSTIVNLAHALGVLVIAEGVETKDEYLAAKDIGCDLAQGYFVARPETDLDKVRLRYEEIEMVSVGDKRLASGSKSARDRQFIEEKLDIIPPIPLGSTFMEIYEAFRRSPQNSYLPVVDSKTGSFVGIVREPNIRYYIYSPFGKELLENKYYGKKLADFVSYFPVADIGLGLEKILEVMHQSQDSDGIVILENSKYLGFLSAISMIRVINERNLFTAQNQNPLSGLPGNATIIDFVNEAIATEKETAVMAYFDFDNFKPFNDTYGFRQGDRAIMLFTDLMKKRFGTGDAFLGHVGGDDFFLGIRNRSLVDVQDQILNLLESFRQDVESFYSPEHREVGFIEVKDRSDEFRRFPLMGVSAAVIEMPAGEAGSRSATVDSLSMHFAELKKLAKKKCKGFCAATIVGNERTNERGATRQN